jgi:hypothetical protein
MPSLRGLAAALAMASLAGLVVASAASLGGVDVNGFGAGSAVVVSCDADGVGLDYVVTFDDTSGSYVVTDVDVSGIDPACAGAELSLVLTDSGTTLASAGPTVVPDEASTLRMPLDAPVPAAAVDRVSVLLEGP